MSAIETWRVLTDDGTARDVSVKRYDSTDVEAWLPDAHNRRASGSSERLAVARLAVDCGWPVVGIVAPGDPRAMDLRSMYDRTLADESRRSWHDRWATATVFATMAELGAAHVEAFDLLTSAHCALTDRLVALGADRWGLGVRHPSVSIGMPWFVGMFLGHERLHTCTENPPTNDGRDWFCDNTVDGLVDEKLRVQVLGEFTLVLTRGGFVVVETALRCEPPPWFVERADAPVAKGGERE